MGNLWDKPYAARTDEEKIHTQWIKTNGLLQRHDWSAAVVRATTAMEMSANLAIAEEFGRRPEFTAEDLRKALWFGLKQKLKKLRPFLSEEDRRKMAAIQLQALATYNKRNSIVHAGEFCGDREALDHAATSRTFVMFVVPIYRSHFVLTGDTIRSEDDPGS